jgi:glycosyltransferase involved in cell wall biosynthesis
MDPVGPDDAVGAGPVWLYNPLPRMLRHYEVELRDVLASAGFAVLGAEAPSVEGLGSPASRVRGALSELAAHARRGRRDGHLVVCWPTWGLLEPLLWLPVWRGSTVSIVVHDPSPLRRQIGMGSVAAALGRRAAGAPHLRVVAHSRAAAERLVEIGWDEPVLLPHPLLPARPRASEGLGRERGTVLVCGQYKPARDTALLARLGPWLRGRGHRAVIAGRGWPQVEGWEVIDKFLAEDELDAWIGRSSAVLIPYQRFYQSGIAVRATELGVPVVGPRHPFLAELCGPGWPGLVDGADPADWAAAVARVAGRSAGVLEAAAASRARCERAWAGYLGRVPAARR